MTLIRAQRLDPLIITHRETACRIGLIGDWLAEHVPAGIYRYRPDRDEWEVNSAFLRMLDCQSVEDLEALAPAILASPERKTFWSGSNISGKSYSGCSTWPVASGGMKRMSETVRGTTLRDGGGICWEGILLPESGLSQQPRELASAEFWASFGRLCGGLISRQLRAGMSMLSASIVGDARGTAGAGCAADVATRSALLVVDYLNNWHDGTHTRELLEAVIAFLQATTPEGVTLEASLSADDVLLAAAPAELSGILLSLAQNSITSCGAGGVIQMTSAVQRDHGNRPASLRIRITDTGSGLEPGHRLRARSPQFTPTGEGGTGLGVSTVAEIASRLGGRLAIDCRPGEGSSMTLCLPCCPAEPDAKPGAAGGERKLGPILIAHRDPKVSGRIAQSLARCGIESESVPSGPALIDTLNRCRRHYDVVLAELLLPGIFGRQLAQELAQADPTTHVVFLGDSSEARLAGVDKRFDVVSPDIVTQDLLNLITRLQGREPLRHSPSILIADDDPVIRGFLAEAISSFGAEIIEAENGRQAIEVLQARPVDLLIVDLFMPDVEGLETIKSIRRNSSSLRIIAVSGAPEIFLKAARLMGADIVLPKPVRPAALRASVAALLTSSSEPAPQPRQTGVHQALIQD